MARGERIGDAYVRIHADGRGMNKEVRDSFKELDPEFEKAGKKNSEAYSEAYAAESKRQRSILNKDILKGFDENFARMAARVNRASIPLERSIQKKFKSIFENPTLAKIATDNLMRDIADGFRSVGDENLFSGLEAQMRRASKDFEGMLDDALKMNREFDQKVSQDRDRFFDAESKRMAEEAKARDAHLRTGLKNQQLVEDFRKRQADAEAKRTREEIRLGNEREASRRRSINVLAAERAEVVKLQEVIDRIATGHAKFGETVDFTRSKVHRLTLGLQELNVVDEESRIQRDAALKDLTKIRREIITLTPKTAIFTRRWNDLGDSIGRISGRGSRNNFLNFIGSLNRNLFNGLGRIISIGPKLVGTFAGVVAEFKELRSLGAKPLEALGGAMSGLFSTIASGLPGLVLLGVGITALVGSAAVLTSVLSGLLAVATALVGVLSFGLAGAASAMAGVLLPIAATIGTVVAAFQSLDKEQKKALKNDLKPLTNAFKELGDAAADVLFRDVGEWAASLAPLIEEFRPAVRGIAREIRDGIGGAIDSLNKKGEAFGILDGPFERFRKQMNVFLPQAARSLTDILANVLGGMAGVFVALIPITERFLGWLEKITGEFANWANSAEGQAALKQFFKDAGDAAETLGDFIKEASKFLGELFDQSKDTGADFFEDMANALGDVVDWLRSPEGQQAMKDWMEFAKDFGEALGTVVVTAIKLFDTLDNPTTRTVATGLIESFSVMFTFIDTGIRTSVQGFRLLGGAIGAVGGFLDGITDGLAEFVRATVATPGRIQSAFSGLGSGIAAVFTAGLSPVLALLSQVHTAITNIPTPRQVFAAIRTALTSVNSLINTLISRIPQIPTPANVFAALVRAGNTLVGIVGDLISLIPTIPIPPNPFGAALNAATNLLGIVNSIVNAISRIRIPSLPNFNFPGAAMGGIFQGAQNIGVIRRIGEDGAEAVVPLNRPLGQVDPSVRALSAIAQGKAGAGMAAGGIATGRQITVPEINVYETADGKATAQEVLNHLVGVGY